MRWASNFQNFSCMMKGITPTVWMVELLCPQMVQNGLRQHTIDRRSRRVIGLHLFLSSHMSAISSALPAFLTLASMVPKHLRPEDESCVGCLYGACDQQRKRGPESFVQYCN